MNLVYKPLPDTHTFLVVGYVSAAWVGTCAKERILLDWLREFILEADKAELERILMFPNGDKRWPPRPRMKIDSIDPPNRNDEMCKTSTCVNTFLLNANYDIGSLGKILFKDNLKIAFANNFDFGFAWTTVK